MSDPVYGERDPRDDSPEAALQPPPNSVPVQRPTQRPWVSYTIIGVTVAVFLLQSLSSVGIFREPFLALARVILGEDLLNVLLTRGLADDLLILLGGKIPSLIAEGQIWRLFTPALLHASLVHIGFNMYALYAFGPSLESYYGHGRFFGLYLLSAFGGNVLSFLLSPGISVGASTAVFGLVAAEGVFVYQNREFFGRSARAMLTNIAVIVGINLILGLSPGIDNWGHLGGLIAGLAFAWFAGPVIGVEGIYPMYQFVDRRPPAQAWVAGIVVLVVFVGLAVLGF